MVISVTDAGDGFVRHGGAGWAIEQCAYFIAHAVDADGFPCAVTAEVGQSDQCLACCTAAAQLPVFIPERVIVSVHYTNSPVYFHTTVKYCNGQSAKIQLRTWRKRSGKFVEVWT